MKSFLTLSCTLLLVFFLVEPIAAQDESSEEIVVHETRNWTLFLQAIDVSSDEEINFKLVASAKVERDDDWSKSALFARVINKDGEYGFFDNMGERPIESAEWNSYTIEGSIGENADQIVIGGQAIGNGKFFFDDFELSFETSDGSFEIVDIENGSFEMQAETNGAPGWDDNARGNKSKGISKKYTFSSSSDDKIEGDLSLLIQGEGAKDQALVPIGPRDGYSPQMGTLVSMLNNLNRRLDLFISDLSQEQLDRQIHEDAFTTGQLMMYFISYEVFHQGLTFGGTEYDEEYTQMWEKAANIVMGDDADREAFKGNDAQYYLDIWTMVRSKTLDQLQSKDDKWLAEVIPGLGMNNHFAWFHLMEHQSYRLGQMELIGALSSANID